MKIMATQIDWYERRDELAPGQVYTDFEGNLVKLDRGVPGDGTRWYVASWYPGIDHPDIDAIYRKGHWSYDDSTIEPGDLRERADDPDALKAA
jgi:hypothetical protein